MHRPSAARSLAVLAAVSAVATAGAVVLIAAAGPSNAAANCSNGYVGLTYDDGPTGNTGNLLNTLRACLPTDSAERPAPTVLVRT